MSNVTNSDSSSVEGVNRGMQVHRSVPFFRQIRLSAKILFTSESRSVKV